MIERNLSNQPTEYSYANNFTCVLHILTLISIYRIVKLAKLARTLEKERKNKYALVIDSGSLDDLQIPEKTERVPASEALRGCDH